MSKKKKINTDEKKHTYRKGKKVYLVKEQDQLVVREIPENPENNK